MKVNTDFEIKHFVKFTQLKGGTLEVLHSDADSYTVEYQGDAYKLSYDALQQVKLLNQNLRVKNRILQ
jgi:hypothetical protein